MTVAEFRAALQAGRKLVLWRGLVVDVAAFMGTVSFSCATCAITLVAVHCGAACHSMAVMRRICGLQHPGGTFMLDRHIGECSRHLCRALWGARCAGPGAQPCLLAPTPPFWLQAAT